MNKLLLLIWFLMVGSMAFAQSSKHATARIVESQNKKLSRIVLVYETGESEIIPLSAFQFFGNDIDNTLIDNQKTINKLINDMAEKGYQVAEMNTTGEAFFYTLILFTKQD